MRSGTVRARRGCPGGIHIEDGMTFDELKRRAAAMPGVIPFGGGLPSPLQFPRAALQDSFARVLAEPGAPALQYGWPEGFETLRERLADDMRRRGVPVEAGDLIVTSGAQQAIAIAADFLCARTGAEVGVEAESYPAALALFRAHDAVPSPISDTNSACYVMPAVDNPHGRGLDGEGRRRLLELSRPIIEDDAYADLRFDGATPRPLAAEAPERVWYVGTFSKTLCPGLRVGWLVPPRQHLEAARRLKQDGDLQASGLGQAMVADYLQHNDFGARLRALRVFYARRAERLATELARQLPGWQLTAPDGGFSLWLLPDAPFDELELLAAAVERAVTFDPGSSFRRDRAPYPGALRLSYSLVDETLFEEGVARLASAWQSVGHRRPAVSAQTGAGA